MLAVWDDHSRRWKPPKKKTRQPGGAGDPSWGRTPLALAVSSNDGKTWKLAKLIEQDPSHGYCYTAIHFVEDAVLLAYCCGGGGNSAVLQDLCLRRLTLDWVYAKT